MVLGHSLLVPIAFYSFLSLVLVVLSITFTPLNIGLILVSLAMDWLVLVFVRLMAFLVEWQSFYFIFLKQEGLIPEKRENYRLTKCGVKILIESAKNNKLI